jgi:predicted Co/Zn/Cd cation transporter (cation efflux family)
MPPPDSAHERRALLLSIVASALLGALGVVWGVASGSQMILLDGAYAVIGIALSALLMRASRLARVGPTGRYHYGQQAATPLVIGLQGLVLLGTLLFAALEAIATIRDGGSEVTPGWAVLYSVIVTVGSVVFWVWLRRRTGGRTS